MLLLYALDHQILSHSVMSESFQGDLGHVYRDVALPISRAQNLNSGVTYGIVRSHICQTILLYGPSRSQSLLRTLRRTHCQ